MAIDKFQRSRPPHPHMVKTLLISYSMEQKANGLGTWLVCSIGDVVSSRFAQMMNLA